MLFDHLERDNTEYVRSRMVAASGGTKMTEDQFDHLVAAYRGEKSVRVRQQFAAAVAQSAGGRLPEVVELILDPSLGDSRVVLIRALRRSRRPEAPQTLESSRSDPDLKVEIARRLKP